MKEKLWLLILFVIAFSACEDRPDVEIHDNGLAAFPNPVGEQLYIVVENSISASLKVFDPKGDIIFNQKVDQANQHFTVEIGDLPGTYQVILKTENSVITRKIVKAWD